MDRHPEFSVTAPPVRDYYVDLKVARDAPPEVIRAAYRALAQKHHPDRHQGSAYQAGILATLNKAQEVLLDPARRAEHDLWIENEHRRLRQQAAHQQAPLSLGALHAQQQLLLARGSRDVGVWSGPSRRQRAWLVLVGVSLAGLLVAAGLAVFAGEEIGARGANRAVSCAPSD